MDFPASPTDGQVYGNYVWSASTGAWLSKGVTQTTAVTSDVPPSNPKAGDMWYNSTDGVMYLYYYDGNSYQWVQFKNDASFSSALGPRVDSLEANANTNYIINGAFDIWQRGTSFTNPASFTGFTADRWLQGFDGTGATRTWTQQTHTPGAAPVAGLEGAYFLRLAQTVAGTGSSYNMLYHRVEDVRSLAGQTVTLSFYAKAGASLTMPAVDLEQSFGSGGSANVYTGVANNISVGTSWTRYSYTVTLPSISGKTIGASSWLGIRIFMPVNATFTFDIWGVQLQAGAIATAFHRNAPSLQAELAACQRYYWRMNAVNTNQYFCGGVAETTSTVYGVIRFPQVMRIAPTADFSSYANFGANGQSFLSPLTALSLYTQSCTTDQTLLAFSKTTSFTAGYYYHLTSNINTAYLGFNAEL
jgi:hypothetical protein